jgi:cyclopropane fatty-acyl-phospholipid synthase-like methyltransferase
MASRRKIVRTSGQTACRFAAAMTNVTAYDEVRYSDYPYAQTHPDRLATVAALHGLPSPDPETARVLEIGCGAGGNLIAMAVATPGITALGIDLASQPIAEGRATIEAVGLGNVELRQGDVSELGDGGLGEFDFVIAHGVYAWVPEPVRDDLLRAIHAHLAADGLAYVSYNANPGGVMRRALREAGLWFSAGAAPGVERAERARVLFRFLRDNRAGTSDWWGGLLESQLDGLAEAPVSRLVHDDLSEHWAPVWFADFAERAAANRLAYVGESDLTTMLPERVPPAVAGELDAISGGDRIRREQLIDILRSVFFRQSVLCRDSRRPADAPDPSVLRDLHFGVRAGEPGREQPEGLLGSALALLRSREPDTLPFGELRAATSADPDELAEALHQGFLAELVMPHRSPLRTRAADGVERPVASPLARFQARTSSVVTSLAYTTVHMEEPAARLLLTLLDGTRDRPAILAEFRERTGVALSAEDLDANLAALGRLFLLSE